MPSCPAPDRTSLVAILGAGDGTVVAGLACPTIGNGRRVAALGELAGDLERLTG